MRWHLLRLAIMWVATIVEAAVVIGFYGSASMLFGGSLIVALFGGLPLLVIIPILQTIERYIPYVGPIIVSLAGVLPLWVVHMQGKKTVLISAAAAWSACWIGTYFVVSKRRAPPKRSE